MNDFRSVAIEVAKEAGELILSLKDHPEYEMKSKYDVLAEGDTKSEELIISKVKSNFPDHSILSEEAGANEQTSEFYWVIDPIDGTINYVKGIEDFCVSIALEQKGELVLGVVYLPVSGKLYVAEKGKGAELNGKPIHVSSETELINTILSTENSSTIETRLTVFNILSRACDKVRNIRITGSSEITLARVAEGQFDFFFKPRFNYWDVAAGIVLIREAGGKVSDWNGSEFNRNSPNIIATNGLVHDQVKDLIDSSK